MLASYQLSGCLLRYIYSYTFTVYQKLIVKLIIISFVMALHITEYIHPVIPALFSTILASYCFQNYVACWPHP